MKSASVGTAATQRLVLIYKDEDNCAIFWTARDAQTFLDNTPTVHDDDGSIKFPKGRSLIAPKYWNYKIDVATAALQADDGFAAETTLARAEGRDEKSVMKPAALRPLTPLKINRLDQSSLWAEVHGFDSEPSSIRSNVLRIRSEYGPKPRNSSSEPERIVARDITGAIREISINAGASLADDIKPNPPEHPAAGVPSPTPMPVLA